VRDDNPLRIPGNHINPSAPDAALIRGLFDLTAAEARVASGIAEGLTVKQIANRSRVAPGTVRDQIKRILAKTGAGRQSQLASMLGAMPKIPMR
jgi:DNA-binding NarL/FixJ family response regulator